MEGQYPIKPYKRPLGTTRTSHKITCKMGKTIELFFDEATPKIITFYLRSNRGTLKDTLEISREDARHLAKTLGMIEQFSPESE